MADLFARVEAALSDRYAILREVGSGGMATVYLATDIRHQRRVAVKVLKPEVAAALGTDRFLREIEIVSQLHHPHILPLYDSGEADGFLYFVMPYVEGESVRQRLEREQQLPIDEALRITREVAEALSYSHSLGIVHRDIKPENILLESGHALVTDFGVARVVFDVDTQRITETGIAVGTPAYMSPEQAAGNKRIDGRSDVYSLACVLYEMLAGEPPHTGPTPQAILARQLTGEVRSITPLRSTVRPALDANIKRALSPAPADRFATPTQFIEALVADRQVVPGRVLWRRWARRAAIGVVSVVAVGVVALGVRTVLTLPEAQAGERPVTLAVFPFRGTGPEAGSLGEGVADVLAAALDGTVGMTVSDPTALWRPLGRSRDGVVLPPDVDQALELAGRVSARGMVLGSVLGAGGRLEIAARIYKGDSLSTTLTASTSVDSLVQAMDRLAIEVVAALWERDTLPTVPVIEQIATGSIAALQAYLRGMHLKRAGRYDAAEEEMRRAAELDSTFALAHMEWFNIRSIVLYLNAQPFVGLRPIIERAMQHRERLSLRNRLRVEAAYAMDQTEGVRAAALLERVLGIDSADADAAQHLAFAYLRDGWQMGKRTSDIVAAFDRAVVLDSSALIPVTVRLVLGLETGDREATARLLNRLRSLDTLTPLVQGRLGAVDALEASEITRDSVLRRLANRPLPVVTMALRDLRTLRPQLAERLVEELMVDTMPTMHQRTGSGSRTQLWMAQGRVAATDSVVRRGSLDAIRQTVNRFFVASMLAGVGDTAATRRAIDELRLYAPPESLAVVQGVKWDAWTTGWAAGAGEATVGDTSAARAWQRALETLEPGETPWDWIGALSADIEARLAVRRNDQAAAKREAGRAFALWTLHSNYAGEADPEPAMRFHLAEILRASGAVDSAAALYRSLSQPHTWIGFYTARSAFELGEIARARGQRDEAARQYRIAERLWELGEPDVVGPWLDRTRAGQRLLGVR